MSVVAKVCPRAGLFLLAIAWPLGVYQYIPSTSFSFEQAGILLLLTGALTGRRAGRRGRLPWDLAWPALLAMVLLCTAYWKGQSIPMTGFGAALAYLLVVDRACTRRDVDTALFFGVLGAALGAAATWCAWGDWLMPSAWWLRPGGAGMLAFARTPAEGAWTLLAGAILGGVLAFNASWPRMPRVLALTGGLVCGLTLAAARLPLRELCEGGFDEAQAFPWVAGALFCAAWLMARTLSRLFVSRLEDPPGLQIALLAGLSLITVSSFYLGMGVPWVGAACVFGLAGAYTQRERPEEHRRRTVLVPMALVLLAAGVNAAVVFPQNRQDPRYYEYRARAMYEREDYRLLLLDMDAAARVMPAEWRTHWWQARALLALDQSDAAVDAMERALSVDPGEARAVKLPRGPAVTAFLGELRDHVSARPAEERGLAYERALVGTGDLDNAAASLRLRLGPASDWTIEPGLAARTVAVLARAPALTDTLAAWDSVDLARLLRALGARAAFVPGDAEPGAIVARWDAGVVEVVAVEANETRPVSQAAGATEAAGAPLHWTFSDSTVALCQDDEVLLTIDTTQRPLTAEGFQYVPLLPVSPRWALLVLVPRA